MVVTAGQRIAEPRERGLLEAKARRDLFDVALFEFANHRKLFAAAVVGEGFEVGVQVSEGAAQVGVGGQPGAQRESHVTAFVSALRIWSAGVDIPARQRHVDGPTLATQHRDRAVLPVAPARHFEARGVRPPAAARDDVDGARHRIRTVHRRERAPHHFDSLDRVDVQRGEIEGAAAIVVGIVHPNAVQHHDRLVRVEATQIERCATAAAAGLVEMKAREVAQRIRNLEMAVELDLLARDDIDRCRKLVERARRGRCGDDEGLDGVGILRLAGAGLQQQLKLQRSRVPGTGRVRSA